MRRSVSLLAWAVVFVALGAAGASWFTPRADLTAADASATTIGALASVGFDATVTEPVTRSVHQTENGDDVLVWVVFADVGDDRIETDVLVDAGQLVYVDDRIGPDGTQRLLSDDQFLAIADYRNDATLDDWVRRNASASVGALLIALAGSVLAKRSDPLWRTFP